LEYHALPYNPEDYNVEDMQKAIKTCFAKYANFNGRAARPEFWWFALFEVIVLAVAGLLGTIVYAIAALALLLPGLAVSARRLHDIGKSGWFLLIGLIPLVGGLYLLYLCAQPGTPANSYGEAPASPDASAGMRTNGS
jgi:uncharacterized membrane protein YhaH (DUF805 family)